MENLEPTPLQSPVPSQSIPFSPPPPPPPKPSLFLPIFLTILITSALLIGGYFGYQKYLSTQKSTPSPLPIAQPTPTPDPTADWRIFNSDKYTFKYPNDWDTHHLINSNSLIVGPLEKIEEIRGISDGWGGGKIIVMSINLVAQKPDIVTNESRKVTSESVLIDNHEATKYRIEVLEDNPIFSKGDVHYIVVVESNNSYIEIRLSDVTYLSIYDQILSSFKFQQSSTELTTNDWQTIESDTITLSYPKDWTATLQSSDYWITQGASSKQEIDLFNKSKSIKMTISPGQVTYGFGGDISITEKKLTFTVFDEPIAVTEKTIDNRDAYIDFKVSQNGQDYFILAGTGYPAGSMATASLTDYQHSQQTIKAIIESIKVK